MPCPSSCTCSRYENATSCVVGLLLCLQLALLTDLTA